MNKDFVLTINVRTIKAAAGELVTTRTPTRDDAADPAPASSTNNSEAVDKNDCCDAIKSLKASCDIESPASTTVHVPAYLG